MRTLLLGLDGLDPALVEQFNLSNIKSVGKGFEIDTYGNSGPSWASVLTGLSPREHGIHKLEPQQDSQSWEGAPIWEKINGYSGIANVPLTYPPRELRGWMVTGLMTPQNVIYTYPQGLYKELDDVGYRIDMWTDNHRNHPHGHFGTVPFEFDDKYREEKLQELEDVMSQRTKGFKYLLKNKPVDFAFLVYTSLDRVQHFAFHDNDIIEYYYNVLDKEVGKILEVIDNNVEIFITSDHGFQEIDMPDTDITGEHRREGYGNTNTDNRFRNLMELHEVVIASANRSNVEERLDDLGYLE